jgi:putative transposase
VFAERLRKTIEYDEVHLRACGAAGAAETGISCHQTFYTWLRPHSALDGKTPDTFYFGQRPALPQAAQMTSRVAYSVARSGPDTGR